ncbi:MAG: Na+/H+ antiporter subunit E [Betaproteobacteria bacterium]|jgi:multicomponent Na+:H+ antiporter subunit E|nr:Na+/H+ antiporter subunit E [Betaproteobacteria bacterium]MDH5286737.1 Na+/H+ antiporter subunit E [Betaproteobacteria bacterium]
MVVVAAFVLQFVFWLLLSGVFTPFLVAAGAGSAIAVVWFARRMDMVDVESFPLVMWRTTFHYWPWLLKEICKSGWTVTRIVLDPKLPVSPTLVRFRPLQRTPVGLVTHANSITLTPGTITIEATPEEFLVHGLTRDGAHGCVDSEMDRRVAALEGAP